MADEVPKESKDGVSWEVGDNVADIPEFEHDFSNKTAAQRVPKITLTTTDTPHKARHQKSPAVPTEQVLLDSKGFSPVVHTSPVSTPRKNATSTNLTLSRKAKIMAAGNLIHNMKKREEDMRSLRGENSGDDHQQILGSNSLGSDNNDMNCHQQKTTVSFDKKGRDLGWGFTKTKHNSRPPSVPSDKLMLEKADARTTATDAGSESNQEPERKESYHALAWKFDAARRSRLREKREKQAKSTKVSSISAPPSRPGSNPRSSAVPSVYSVGSMDSGKYRSYDIITPLDW